MLKAPKELTQCRAFFLEPSSVKQRQYEALRAFFVDGRPSREVARAFGYSPGAFRVLCHHFRRDDRPTFFVSPQMGPRTQPKKAAAREIVIALRKRNYSIYEISDVLKEQGVPLSPTAVREVLKEEGFAALPRRLDSERPARIGPTVEPVADVRHFSLLPQTFATRCGGLFLFLADLVRLRLDDVVKAVGLPGSRMIPPAHALRACLALKLWGIERKSHAMALVADPGIALFAGLNALPKKSFLSEYSCRITHSKTIRLLAAWHDASENTDLFSGKSLNLDFHSIPYYGEHPVVEGHYVSMRSRRQKSILVFLAQDAASHTFCYSNADLRKGEQADEILEFISFWKKTHGKLPEQLVFDSQLTTYDNLAKLDRMNIRFITLRRRSRKLLQEVALLPRSAWRRIELDVPTRKYRHPRIFEQTVSLKNRQFRQIYILDLGHEQATILLTNEKRLSAKMLVTRYAQRMLIENALSDAVRFFHMNALSSTVGLKIDFDMALLVIASTLYRLLARTMRGYSDSQSRRIFRDLIDTPATVTVGEERVEVSYPRRAHLPILLASGLFDREIPIPWWNGKPLFLTTYRGPSVS